MPIGGGAGWWVRWGGLAPGFPGPVLAQECCACTRVLCMHKNLVHAQESCAFLTMLSILVLVRLGTPFVDTRDFLCMHKILVHARHSCACTTLLCMHWRGQGPRPGPKKTAAPGLLCRHNIPTSFLHNNEYCSETFPYQRSKFLVHLHLHSRLMRIQ